MSRYFVSEQVAQSVQDRFDKQYGKATGLFGSGRSTILFAANIVNIRMRHCRIKNVKMKVSDPC